MRFRNKVAIVTAAGSGIGCASALLFMKEGASVVVADVSLNGKMIAEEIKKSGGKAIFVKTGVSKEKEVERLMEKTVSMFGGIDTLINNAGIAGPRASLANLEEKDFDRLVGVNLKGTSLCCKYAIPHMKRGAIVNVASELALTGSPKHPLYAATKAAVVGLTKALARDVAKKIRMNCFCPGAADTPLLEEFMGGESMLHWASSEIPLGRVGKPEEIASVILFLASEEASFMNGVIVVVDGGATS